MMGKAFETKTLRPEVTPSDFEQFVRIILKAVKKMDHEVLEGLDDHSYYSHQDKTEIIDKLRRVFIKWKDQGIKKLKVVPSKCKSVIHQVPHSLFKMQRPMT